MPKDIIAFDYETFSEVDLKLVGTDVYAKHPSTEVLMGAFKINGGPVEQWDAAQGQSIPKIFLEAYHDPEVEKWAWNSAFELQISEHVLKLPVKLDQWFDSMILAMSCSMPGKLEKVGPIINIDDAHLKDNSGTRLINKFSKTKISRRKADFGLITRTHWYDDLPDWENYLTYNRRDVGAESAIRNRLIQFGSMPDFEWDLWRLDQKINRAGIPMNMKMVRNAWKTYERILEDQLELMKQITGLDNPNSTAQLLPWMVEHGYIFENCQKSSINVSLDYFKNQPEHWSDQQWSEYLMNDALKEVLELRLETSRTSIKKYLAIMMAAGPDGLLRNTFQFCGAQRTWRWAGRIYQPQNLPRPEPHLEKLILDHAHNVEVLDHEAMNLLYANVFDVLASTIRPAAQAPDDMMFCDADLNAIENRVLGWLAQCQKILNVYRDGKDPYIAFGSLLYGISYDQLWHDYKNLGLKAVRTISKPGTLGCPRGDTLVLTNRGWVRLDKVRDTDLVHDGVEWVSHDGVVDQGVQSCVNLSGVVITGDHKIWQGENSWLEAGNQDSQSWKKAIEAAVLLLSDTSKTDLHLGRFICADAIAVAKSRNEEIVLWNQIGHNEGALIVQDDKDQRTVIELGIKNTICSPIDFTRFDQDAKIQKATNTKTTVRVALNAISNLSMNLLSSVLIFLKPMATLKSTVKIMMEITSLKIYVSVIGVCKTVTGVTLTPLSMVADGIPPQNFIAFSRQGIGIQVPSQRSQTTALPHKKSLTISRSAGEHMTFDILNAGPRNRFTILSADGPAVIHNCGYQMGAGTEYIDNHTGERGATGLLGYAWNMGVKHFTLQDSIHSVKTFRGEFLEVPIYWKGIENAAKKTIKTGKPHSYGEGHGVVTFDIFGQFMRMILPSKRALHYVRPKIELKRAPWGDKIPTITYEGLNEKKQWVRIDTHGGKLTENADQAISRDLLAHGMTLADKRGLDIRMHVHDQIVTLSQTKFADRDLKILIECMEEAPSWAPDMPLGSAGFISKMFIKD